MLLYFANFGKGSEGYYISADEDKYHIKNVFIFYTRILRYTADAEKAS